MADGESLWQGPASLVPISQSIDPSLAHTPGTSSYYDELARMSGLAAGFGPGAIRAWHGTPHQFGPFSNEAIGSGQGAQSFGWGHYVAGAKPVAEHYQQELSGQPQFMYNDPDVGIQSFSDHMKGLNWEKSLPGAQWTTEDLAKYNALQRVNTLNPVFHNDIDKIIQTYPEDSSVRNWLNQNRDKVSISQPGHLLEIHVKPEEHELLDWDQHPNADMLKKLDPIFTRDPEFHRLGHATGEDIYNYLSNLPGADKERASSVLHQAGIPGIKYLDSGSRNLPPGHPDATSNYVIFDPSNLEIRSRDGIPMTPVEGDPFK